MPHFEYIFILWDWKQIYIMFVLRLTYQYYSNKICFEKNRQWSFTKSERFSCVYGMDGQLFAKD